MPVDRKTTNRGILTKNFRRLTDRLYRIHREPTVPRRLLSAARHTEVGLGLAWRKKIAVISGHQNAFDHLPQVMHFDTLEDFMQWLQVFESAAALEVAA